MLINIVRHSQAEKTLRQVHGGSGTSLTRQGVVDSHLLADFLRSNYSGRGGLIVSSARQQALETAKILSEDLEVPLYVDDRLANINMGLFDGLTDEQARAADAEAMRRLELWRAGELPVEKIEIPGSEPLSVFLARVGAALAEVGANGETTTYVCTRSVGIALINLLLGYQPGVADTYRRYRLDPGSVTSISVLPGLKGTLQRINDTSYLPSDRFFADD